MVAPIVDGPPGDEGTDGIWGTITDTVSGLIHNAGDYLHEKFLTTNDHPGNDQSYYTPYGPEAPAHGQVSGRGPGTGTGGSQGMQFWNIPAIYLVGAAALVAVVLIARR